MYPDPHPSGYSHTGIMAPAAEFQGGHESVCDMDRVEGLRTQKGQKRGQARPRHVGSFTPHPDIKESPMRSCHHSPWVQDRDSHPTQRVEDWPEGRVTLKWPRVCGVTREELLV